MKKNVDYSLYLVTDRDLMSTETVEEAVEKAVKGGCTIVQLREKTTSSLDFYHLACRVKEITQFYHVPLVINDRIDIALAIDAEGVHLGQSDLPAPIARKLIGGEKLLGISAANATEGKAAEEDGADYIGVGAMFSTATKPDARVTGFEELEKIREQVTIPIVAIGGINKDIIPLFPRNTVDGYAVVSAIIAQPDIEYASAELKKIIADRLRKCEWRKDDTKCDF